MVVSLNPVDRPPERHTCAYAASGHAAGVGVIAPAGSGIEEVVEVGSSRGLPDTNHSRG